MIRQGQKVETLTKRVGQRPRRGTVESVEGNSVTVVWDDGGRSIVSRISLKPARRV